MELVFWTHFPSDLVSPWAMDPRQTPCVKAWKLQYRPRGRGPNTGGEQIYFSEEDFLRALQTAYHNFPTELSATLPDGSRLAETELRQRFPPK